MLIHFYYNNANALDDDAILGWNKSRIKIKRRIKSSFVTDEEKKEAEKYGADLVNWYYESKWRLNKILWKSICCWSIKNRNEDVRSLRELVYGLKGLGSLCWTCF